MPAVRGITVSIGYADTLAVCLVRNMRHMVECLVVTSPEDVATQAVARSVPGVRLHVTDAATRHGARFNKGLCMEEGFDVLGRDGWLLIHDADVIFSDFLPLDRLNPAALYGTKRRILDDPGRWHPGLNWTAYPPSRDNGPIGFFQLFHAAAPALRGVRPWYNVNYPHAGGGDAQFIEHWKKARQPIVMLPAEVLHLGPIDTNWWGTDPEGRDMMAAYVHRMGWRRAMGKADPTAVDRVGEMPERVDVPGYQTSDYAMPFERRAKARKS